MATDDDGAAWRGRIDAMLFYESAVIDYLKADRAVFVNAGCCIQLNEGPTDTSGPHWYCDAIACDFRANQVFLCEVTFEKQMTAVAKRLGAWHKNWDGVCAALRRDNRIPLNMEVRTWLFVPTKMVDKALYRLNKIPGPGEALKFKPKITPLEAVQPWRYPAWNRRGEEAKPDNIPEEMR